MLVTLTGAAPVQAQPSTDFVPVTDAMLQAPAPEDWLMWRRTLNSWGYSPLDEIARENVGELRMVWTRALTDGFQSGTPLVYDAVMYMPNPKDVIQAIDAATGDLIWENRRQLPDDDDLRDGVFGNNRNIAIYNQLIIDTSMDAHVFALSALTGELVWENPGRGQCGEPARTRLRSDHCHGKAITGRSCVSRRGPEGCVVTAHDAKTGEELWRRHLIPAPGEPGSDTWGDVAYEDRKHVGAWMVPSYDPTLNLIFVGTSVTSPAPKFLLGGREPAPVSQLHPRARCRYGRDQLVLPASQRSLGPRSSV